MKAAMKMLPPSPVAIPAARSAEATVRICSQCGSTSERRAATRSASAPATPAAAPATSP